MIRIAIVEDEEMYIRQLTEYLARYEEAAGERFEITVYEDGDGITAKYRPRFDIILMDIQMKFMDGMSAAEEIRRVDSQVIIIFITNMTQYAIRGYEVDALDYILKPVEYFSFSQKLGRAIERMKRRDEKFITIPVKGGIQKASVSGIYYVESQGHSLIYHTKSGSIESRGVMKEAEDMLVSCGFFRSHKGYLVNMQYVDGIQGGCCLVHGERLPISRTKKNEFMETLVNYMSEVNR